MHKVTIEDLGKVITVALLDDTGLVFLDGEIHVERTPHIEWTIRESLLGDRCAREGDWLIFEMEDHK